MIWVNEQIDSCGIIHSCIVCQNETQAKECHQSFKDDLTEEQKKQGWVAILRTTTTWEDIPVNALRLD